MPFTRRPRGSYKPCVLPVEQLVTSSDVADVNVVCERCDYVGFELCQWVWTRISNPIGRTISTRIEMESGGLMHRWHHLKDGDDLISPLYLIIAAAAFTRPPRMLRSLGLRHQGGGRRGGGGGQRPRREMHDAKYHVWSSTNCYSSPHPESPRDVMQGKVDNGEATKEELAANARCSIRRAKARETEHELFIGGILIATEEQITELFSPHGELKDVHLAMDKELAKQGLPLSPSSLTSRVRQRLKHSKDEDGRSVTIQSDRRRRPPKQSSEGADIAAEVISWPGGHRWIRG